MVAPTFLAVSSSTGCTLADVMVTGYEAPVYDPDMEETEGGCTGADFMIQFLNGNGTKKAAYYWIDDDNGHKGWYASSAGEAIPGGAASVTIPAGQAIWTKGSGYSLVSAGAVGKLDIAFVTPATGNVAVGNATPVEISLSQLTVTGYEQPVYDPDMEETDGGCTGADFMIQILNGNGTKKAAYYWIDDDNGHKGWYATSDGAEIDGGASSVKLAPGAGLWVKGSGYTLNVPAPEL